MNILQKLTVVLGFCACATAMAAPADDASVRELLEVMQSKKLLDGMRGQLEANMDAVTQKTLNGKVPSGKQQRALDTMKSKMMAEWQNELAWEKLEPVYVQMYRDTFTSDEINGLVAFYKTPAGQALINKMPVLMTNIMASLQTMLASMMPRMQAIQKEFAADLKAANP